jgi:hypothetical protein
MHSGEEHGRATRWRWSSGCCAEAAARVQQCGHHHRAMRLSCSSALPAHTNRMRGTCNAGVTASGGYLRFVPRTSPWSSSSSSSPAGVPSATSPRRTSTIPTYSNRTHFHIQGVSRSRPPGAICPSENFPAKLLDLNESLSCGVAKQRCCRCSSARRAVLHSCYHLLTGGNTPLRRRTPGK